MKEIGSEFWLEEPQPYCKNSAYNYLINIGQDQTFTASGGEAINYILQNISTKNKTVYMPNYCCQPMIRPFIDNGYDVEYYNVNMNDGTYDIDENFHCGVFFAFSYFGFSSTFMDEIIRKMSANGTIVLEDITHRMLCDQAFCPDSDYLISSLRKWFPIVNGGIAINMKEKFKHPYRGYRDAVQEELCSRAMALKADYMNGKIDNKTEYLELYQKSNNVYAQLKNRLIADSSVDVLKQMNVSKIKQSRRENAHTISQMLKNQIGILLPLQQTEGDTPIFVPAILKNRDAVRKALIDHNIYLPAHWPVEEQPYNPAYNTELSLVCDQRYSKQDIERYIKILIEILNQS